MQRKKFLQSSLIGGASLLASGIASAASDKKAPIDGPPFHLHYGIHDGMFKNHAGDDFVEQIQFGFDQGFRAIEDNGMMGRTPEQQEKIGDTLAKLGMGMGVFVLDKGGNGANTLAAGKAEYVEIFLKGCRNAMTPKCRAGSWSAAGRSRRRTFGITIGA